MPLIRLIEHEQEQTPMLSDSRYLAGCFLIDGLNPYLQQCGSSHDT